MRRSHATAITAYRFLFSRFLYAYHFHYCFIYRRGYIWRYYVFRCLFIHSRITIPPTRRPISSFLPQAMTGVSHRYASKRCYLFIAKKMLHLYVWHGWPSAGHCYDMRFSSHSSAKQGAGRSSIPPLQQAGRVSYSLRPRSPRAIARDHHFHCLFRCCCLKMRREDRHQQQPLEIKISPTPTSSHSA